MATYRNKNNKNNEFLLIFVASWKFSLVQFIQINNQIDYTNIELVVHINVGGVIHLCIQQHSLVLAISLPTLQSRILPKVYPFPKTFNLSLGLLSSLQQFLAPPLQLQLHSWSPQNHCPTSKTTNSYRSHIQEPTPTK